ncbi:histidine kinase [Streptomyces sp. SID11385]|uniref:sensor histidine kinase n=1 Tax=Streptomyces sp. SID11385 TaxID=2706031 RepID=UPI0013D90722|nr:histidine kinase [Streptomyces sp. SID11385]
MLPDQSSWVSRGERAGRSAHLLSLTITAVVLCSFLLLGIVNELSSHPEPRKFLEAMLLLPPALAIQLVISFPRLVPRLGRYRNWLVPVQFLLTFLPFTTFEEAWMPLPGLFSGSVLLVLPTAAAWSTFALVTLGEGLLYLSAGPGWAEALSGVVSVVLTGLGVFGLSRLSDLVSEVHDSRVALSRLAVEHERLRFARDLHDLLGYGLSATTAKCELARRLLPADEDRTRQELTEVLEIARKALADVRKVASGYRELSLDKEVGDAAWMLRALHVHTVSRVECGTLPRHVDAELATVVREGITNMLRHGAPGRCTITAVRQSATVRLRLTNDGVRAGPSATGGSGGAADCGGRGLDNLAARIEALGGRLVAGVRGDGWFVLEAVLELTGADDARPGEPGSGLSAPVGPT